MNRHTLILCAALAAGGADTARGDVAIGGPTVDGLVTDLDALGVPYTNVGSGVPAPFSAGTIIIGINGGDADPMPDYTEHLEAGGHVIAIGSAPGDTYLEWLSLYVEVQPLEELQRTRLWVSSGVHPANTGAPLIYSMADQLPAYHVTPIDTPTIELLGFDSITPIAAHRVYPGGGSFTLMAAALNGPLSAVVREEFSQPWLRGLLSHCGRAILNGRYRGDFGRTVANIGDYFGRGRDALAFATVHDPDASVIEFAGAPAVTVELLERAKFGWSIAGSQGQLVVGAPDADDGVGAKAGAIIVYEALGARSLTRFSLNGQRAGDRFGYAVAMDTDVDGDGTDDIIVGAPFHDPNRRKKDAGAVYVFSGTDGRRLAKINGEKAGDRFGWSVAGLGRVNGDRFGDFIVGAPKNDNGARNGGTAYVIAGRSYRILHEVSGEKGDALGWAVSPVGLADGDGRVDFAVGAPRADKGRKKNAGRVLVYSGRNGRLLWQKAGRRANDRFGTALASAGDFNGDGRDDVVIGAPRYDGRAKDSGRVYVRNGRNGANIRSFDYPRELPYPRGARMGSSVAGGRNHALDAANDRIIVAGIPRRARVFVGYRHGVNRAGVELPPAPAPAHAPPLLPPSDEAFAAEDAADPDEHVEADADLDVDGNGVTDLADLFDLLSSLGPCNECDGDLDDDGDVDAEDVHRFLSRWSHTR